MKRYGEGARVPYCAMCACVFVCVCVCVCLFVAVVPRALRATRLRTAVDRCHACAPTQHAADEKTTFERLQRSVALTRQPLLAPMPLPPGLLLPLDQLLIR